MDRRGFTSNPAEKVVHDYDELHTKIDALRVLGNKIVCTIGSWDNLHIGHVRYLIQALTHGSILVVGVDSDRGIKAYKGPLRPVIPQDERCEMLSYQEPVHFVALIDDISDRGEWGYGLLEAVRPDVFVAVEDSYPEAQLKEIGSYCETVAVLPRQAETSTSKTIHDTVKNAMIMSTPQIAKELSEELTRLVDKTITPERIGGILEKIEESNRAGKTADE